MLRSAALFATVCISSVAFSADADNWPQFRGPDGDGKSAATGLPVKFGDESATWRTPIPGKAWSSPVVWGRQIWMTTATVDGKLQSAICVDLKSGKIVHDIPVFKNAKPHFCHPTNSYASPTPVVERGRLYAHFGRYGTACIDTSTGKILWSRRDLDCDHFRGPASSPIVYKQLLIAAYDGVDVQYVVALDKRTGDTKWKVDRNIDYGTTNPDRMKAYSTAHVIEVAGKTQVVSPSAAATIAYEPLSGKEIWRVQHGGMNAAARPLFGHGLVYISAGQGKTSLVAVRPDGKGNVTDTHIAWSTGSGVPHRSSQLLVGDLLVMINDDGVVSCLNAKNGQVHWKQRLKGSHWASPVYADGKIYFSSKDGLVTVIAADKEFKQLAANQLDAGINASPAIVGKSLIVRTFTHLYRFDK